MAGIKVIPASEAAEKWSAGAKARVQYYKKNTASSSQDWENNTKAAQSVFQAAVTAADIGRRFGGGVAKAGAAKFARKVTTLGENRYTSGIDAAMSDYQSAIAPFLQALAGLDLGVKAPRGDTANQPRMIKVGEFLHRTRLALLGAGG